MNVAIIDYGSGNIRSVSKAFERISSDLRVTVTHDAYALREASHIVLPGVGAFADCMRGLQALPEMIEIMEEEVIQQRKPFLGICVGMQMLFQKGYEHGAHDGLGWLIGDVVGLPRSSLKIPHMGWNTLHVQKQHHLIQGLSEDAHAYFVHSYHVQCDRADVIATTEYGQPVTAIVARGNIMGMQFHPEKSQHTGFTLLNNFLRYAL